MGAQKWRPRYKSSQEPEESLVEKRIFVSAFRTLSLSVSSLYSSSLKPVFSTRLELWSPVLYVYTVFKDEMKSACNHASLTATNPSYKTLEKMS